MTVVSSIKKSVKLWAFFLLEGGRYTTTRWAEDIALCMSTLVDSKVFVSG